MKKSFAFISLFLLLGVASIFADVTVKKLPDGNVEVYFFYANPRASEVLLAGDFTDWQSGALAMTKTEKGFEITKTFKPTDELRYKFISDGNWTTDLKAPDFVDDGFGGKNSHVVIADMLGGDAGDGAAKAKINFVSWTMIGTQAKFKLQSKDDETKKGFALNGVYLGMKSYNKFAGNFLPNCPVYVEIALAETEIENEYKANTTLLPLISVDDYGTVTNNFANLLQLFSNPVDYIANTTDNSDNNVPGTTVPGPGSRPFLGHLKFGFNTPYINYVTGFNYAKPDVRNAILWTTVSGAWDAGYQHIGGFNVFSLGDKVVAALQEATGLKFDIGIAPNQTADRKGSKYGYWAWAGISNDTFALDFQSNGMYNGDYIFTDPVEHDFILGAKVDQIAIGEAGKLNVALQGLVATHQKTSEDFKVVDANTGDVSYTTCDYFGYSTDVFYRDGKFGLGNIAAQIALSYKQDYNEYRGKYLDQFNASLGYRMRGYEASMLYVRENHDDGTFDLSDMLGVLNSQNIDLSVSGTLQEKKITLGLDANVEMVLAANDGFDSDSYWNASGAKGWYQGRCGDEMEPYFALENGARIMLKPNATVELGQFLDTAWGGTLSAYGTFNFRTDEDTYKQSDSKFRFKNAGLTWSYSAEDKEDFLKGMTVYYGIDNSNTNRLFNTLIAQCSLPSDITVTLGAGLKTINGYSRVAAKYVNTPAVNNPFGAVVGVSKKLANLKKPVIYAQFVYNMDCFKNFGDGQDNLAMSGANVSSRWDKEASVGRISAVDFYDGKAAVRVGIRWDI